MHEVRERSNAAVTAVNTERCLFVILFEMFCRFTKKILLLHIECAFGRQGTQAVGDVRAKVRRKTEYPIIKNVKYE